MTQVAADPFEEMQRRLEERRVADPAKAKVERTTPPPQAKGAVEKGVADPFAVMSERLEQRRQWDQAQVLYQQQEEQAWQRGQELLKQKQAEVQTWGESIAGTLNVGTARTVESLIRSAGREAGAASAELDALLYWAESKITGKGPTGREEQPTWEELRGRFYRQLDDRPVQGPMATVADQLRQYQQEHPDWQPQQIESAADLWRNPKAIVGNLSGMIPYMGATTAAFMAGGPAAAGLIAYGVESDGAYQQAIEAGADPRDAEQAARITGTINAVIELAQVNRWIKFAKSTGRARVASEIMQRTFKKPIGNRMLRLVIEEAIEEVLQGSTEDLTAWGVYGKPPKDFLKQRNIEALLGGLGGGLMGGLGGIGNVLADKASEVVEEVALEGKPADQLTPEQIMGQIRKLLTPYSEIRHPDTGEVVREATEAPEDVQKRVVELVEAATKAEAAPEAPTEPPAEAEKPEAPPEAAEPVPVERAPERPPEAEERRRAEQIEEPAPIHIDERERQRAREAAEPGVEGRAREGRERVPEGRRREVPEEVEAEEALTPAETRRDELNAMSFREVSEVVKRRNLTTDMAALTHGEAVRLVLRDEGLEARAKPVPEEAVPEVEVPVEKAPAEVAAPEAIELPTIREGMKGRYRIGDQEFPVTILGQTTRTLKDKTFQVWEMVDESSKRKMVMWTPENFTSAEAVAEAAPEAAEAPEAQTAEGLISILEAGKTKKGDLDRGLDYYRGMAEGISDEDLAKVLEWSRKQTPWIHRFLGGDIASVMRTRGLKPERTIEEAVVAEVPEGKQPWEMTWAEWQKMTSPESPGWFQRKRRYGSDALAHQTAVHNAVSAGQPVPPSVLREYAGEEWADRELAKREEAPARPADVAKWREQMAAEPAEDEETTKLADQLVGNTFFLGGTSVQRRARTVARVEDVFRHKNGLVSVVVRHPDGTTSVQSPDSLDTLSDRAAALRKRGKTVIAQELSEEFDEALAKREEAKPAEKPAEIQERAISEALSGRGISGDDLLNAQDLARDLAEKGGEVSSDGIATLYHRTTPAAARRIEETGEMTAKEDGLFFGTQPEGQIEGYGEAVVTVRIPLEQLLLNDVFPNEAHVRMPLRKAGQKVRVDVVAPTEAPPVAEAKEAAGREVLAARKARKEATTPQEVKRAVKRLTAAETAYAEAKEAEILAQEPDLMGLEVGDIVVNRNVGGSAEIIGPFKVRVAKKQIGEPRAETWMRVRLKGIDEGKESWTPVHAWKSTAKRAPAVAEEAEAVAEAEEAPARAPETHGREGSDTTEYNMNQLGTVKGESRRRARFTKKKSGAKLTKTEQAAMESIPETGLDIGNVSNGLVYDKTLSRMPVRQHQAVLSLLDRGILRIIDVSDPQGTLGDKPIGSTGKRSFIVKTGIGPEVAAPAYGASNTIVTQKQYEADKKALGEQRLTAGIDVEKMARMVRMGLYHVEALLREAGKFLQSTWIDRMRAEFPGVEDTDLRRAWRKGKAGRDRIKSVWRSERKAAKKSALPSAVKKRMRALAEAGRIGGPTVTLTPRKLLQVTMRKAEIHSARSYLAAAREIIDIHTNLAKYAADRLKGAALTEAQHNRILKVLAKARTAREQQAVIAAVEMIAEVADRREALAYYKKSVKAINIKHMRPEFQEKTRALLESFSPTVPAQDTIRALDDLIEASDIDPDNVVLAELARRARQKVSRMRQVPLRKLPAETIRDIADALLNIGKQNELKNILIVRGEARQAEEVAEELAEGIRKRYGEPAKPALEEGEGLARPAGWVSRFALDHDKPETVVLSLTGTEEAGAYDVLWEQVHEGYDRKLRMMQEAEGAIQESLDDAGLWGAPRQLRKWSRDTGEKKAEMLPIDLPTARIGNKRLKTIRLTRAERMNFYCNAQDPHTRRHMAKGVPITFGHAETTRVVMEQGDIQAVLESLSAEERAICDAALGYVNGRLLNEHLNPAWLAEHGHNLVRRDPDRTYWPNQRNRLFRQSDQPTAIQYMGRMVLERLGIFKERTGGQVPIMIDDFFTVYFGHMNKVASYAAFSLQLRRARALLDQPTVKVAMREAGQGKRLSYLRKYLADVEGLQRVEVAPHLRGLKRLRRQQYIANLGLNLTTAMKQPVSYMLASTEIKAKYLVLAAVENPWKKEDIAEIKRESAWLRNRFEGSRIGILGPTIQTRPLELFFTGKTSQVSEAAMVPIHKGDQAAIVMIWRAAAYEAADMGLDGQELLDYTRKRAERIVYRTQPVWDIVHQSGFGRRADTDFLAGIWTLYSSQTNQNFNILHRAHIKWRANPNAKTRTAMAKASMMMLSTGIMIAGINELRRWIGRGFRPRDEEREWGILEHSMNVVSGLMRMIYGSDLVMGLYEAGKAATKFQRWERTSPYQQVYQDTQDFVMHSVQTTEKAITQERYTAGERKGEFKWKTNAKRLAESASRVGLMLMGIPRFPISIAKGILRADAEREPSERRRLNKALSELNKRASQLALDKKLLPDEDRLKRTRLARVSRLLSELDERAKKKPSEKIRAHMAEIARAALRGERVFEAVIPKTHDDIRLGHMELYEGAAEARLAGKDWDRKAATQAHARLRAKTASMLAHLDTEKRKEATFAAERKARGTVRGSYTDLFNDAIEQEDHKAAVRFARARMALGVKASDQKSSARDRANRRKAEGVSHAEAKAEYQRAKSAINEAID